METITEMIALAKAHAWETLGLYLLFGLLTAAISRRSQIDAWAEAQPRLAGVLKLMRAVNLDYWMILQGLSLLIKGKLPPPKDPPTAGGVQKGSDVLRGLSTLGLCAFLFSCTPAMPADMPTSTLPSGDPCELEGVKAFGRQCGADCKAKGGDVQACLAECHKQIDERCKQ